MKKIIFSISLLLSINSYSQENSDGHYTLGILPVTSSIPGGDSYVENIQSIISSVFSGKTRFTVVDRSTFQEIARERNLQRQEDFINSRKIVEQGKTLGAQYLVSGNITSLSNSAGSVERTNIITGRKYTVYEISTTISLNVQVIDVETGKVKSNKPIVKTVKTETTNVQVAVSNAIKFLEGYLKAWVNDAFPVYMKIIRIESTDRKGLPETVLIKGGEEMDLSKRGKIFTTSSELLVYENEIMVVDGKEYNREIEVGMIKISAVQGEFSVCKVKKGAEKIKKRITEGKTLLLKIISY
ncbi:MAG: CsgG/HfaB family protein [Chitinophagaceae bacterium]|nr:CsgG/HfaB family protein [Chitinophagaceae bacterium]